MSRILLLTSILSGLLFAACNAPESTPTMPTDSVVASTQPSLAVSFTATPEPTHTASPELPTAAPTVTPTQTEVFETPVVTFASLPIYLDSEDPELSLQFSAVEIEDPIDLDLISAEEGLRRATLIAFGWAAGISNAHYIPHEELITALQAHVETKGPTISGANYQRGLKVIYIPWASPPDSSFDLSYFIPGGEPGYGSRQSIEDEQLTIALTYDRAYEGPESPVVPLYIGLYGGLLHFSRPEIAGDGQARATFGKSYEALLFARRFAIVDRPMADWETVIEPIP